MIFFILFLLKSCAHGTPSRIPLIALNQRSKRNTDSDDNLHNDDATHSGHHRTATRHQRINQLDDYNNYHCEDCRAMQTMQQLTITSATNNDDDFLYETQVPVLVVLLILISYICLGTVIFSIWENWSLVDGAYFCFVTLSTIGFGDLVPRKTFHGPDLQLFACCAYLIVGLILVAMSFTLLETQLIWRCKRMAVRFKLRKD